MKNQGPRHFRSHAAPAESRVAAHGPLPPSPDVPDETDAPKRASSRVKSRFRPRMLLFGMAVFLLAVNLRMGVASIGPVLPDVVHDLRTTLVYGSLLTTAPVLMMGLGSPLSARLAARIGIERTVVVALTIVFGATLVRLWTGTPMTLLLSAIVLGSGIAAGNTMLPAVVRRYFPTAATLLTGIYAVGINAGAGVAAYGTPRLAQTLPSTWHGALAAWAAVAAVAIVVWVVISVRSPRMPALLTEKPSPAHAWMAALFFGLQSMTYYGILAWLAPLYEELGWSKSQAGLLISVFTITQLVGAMAASSAVQRTGRLVIGLRVTALVSGVGLVLVAFTPGSAPWLWAAILGVGVGGIFPLTLVIPLAKTSSIGETRSVTASMLLYGYMLGATGPFIVSVLRTASGGFALPFVALAAACAAAAILAHAAVSARTPVTSFKPN